MTPLRADLSQAGPALAAGSRRTAFSLVEIVVALAIVVVGVLVLLGLLGVSLGSVQDSKADSIAVFIANDVKARMFGDDNFPISASANISSATWPYNLYYDGEGNPLGTATNGAKFRAEITLKDLMDTNNDANYRSRRLDFAEVAIHRTTGNTNRAVSSYTIQRARQTPRD
jgi:uncharacterized protein (TIGR02598 family)